MSFLRNAWILCTLGITAIVAPGCSSSQVEEEEGTEDELNASKEGQWVVDLKKAKELYGATSKYFFGMAPEETGLCKVDANGVPEAACAQMPTNWDQAFRFKADHTMVDPTAKMPIVKTADGKMVELQGQHINIIPLLKDTDPVDQYHLRQHMQNGDVLVFFHPEQTSMRYLMDRRASHVAMHYDYKKADGTEVVHHVDNPNSYGPQYNHAPDRQMPFHIFRFKPKGMSAEQSKAYGLNARNWAFIDDDRSPFADFFTLTLQKYGDLPKFRDAALAGQQLPNLYCSGLAYANLNLGVNYALKPEMIRAEGFTREETNDTLKADVLAPDATRALPSLGRLAFEPYTTSELTNAWLDNTYALLPPNAAEGKPSRRAIANSEKAQAQILQGLAQLQFSDAERGEKTAQALPTTPVATPGRIKAWGDAYGIDATQMQAWLGRNPEIAGQVTGERVDVAGKTPMQVLREVELKTIKNRFVGPRIWMDEADRRQWAADPRLLPSLPAKAETDMVYVGTVINCELLAASNGNAASACRGTGGRIKEFSEGGADTSTYPHYAVANGLERTHRRFDASPFSRGRDRDGTTEARSLGKGTKITVRATAADASDLLVLFHTPLMNDTLPENLKALSVKAYDGACTEIYKQAQISSTRGTCAPKQAIVLDLKKSQEVLAGYGHATGKVEDETYSFDLMKVCTPTSATMMKCPVAEQQAGGGWTVVGEKEVSREIPKKKAFVSSTVVDVGQKREAAAVNLCPACNVGGAHFNQWVVTVRDDQ